MIMYSSNRMKKIRFHLNPMVNIIKSEIYTINLPNIYCTYYLFFKCLLFKYIFILFIIN